jgi:uncharacterized membrane protein
MNRTILLTALFLSFALNVFGAGALLGARLSSDRSESNPVGVAPERRGRGPINAAIRSLSPEAQAAWHAQTPTFLSTHGPGLRAARRATQAAIEGLGADPFDANLAATDLKRARDMDHANRLAIDRRLVAFAATLSTEDRGRLAVALARPRPSRGSGQAAAPTMD